MSNETNFPIPPQPTVELHKLPPFPRFCCTIGMIPSSYKVAMSYEEQLMWLCKFLEETVIPTINENTDATNSVILKYNEIVDFLNNYFENLDVQEEINHKLDEMAEDGYFDDILREYINNSFIQYFDSVASLKTQNLSAGQIVGTKGYYAINDGGMAKYIIVDDESLTADNGSIIELNNGLFAKLLIFDNFINVDVFGAKGDGLTNDTTSIQNAINYVSTTKNLNLHFSAKNYLVDSLYITEHNINLSGVKCNNHYYNGTILSSNSAETPLITIYNENKIIVGGSISNIAFMANSNRQDYTTAIEQVAIKIRKVTEFNFENVFISGFKLGGLYAQDWWDSTVTSLEIRSSGDLNRNPALYLGSDVDSTNSIHFFGLHIESCPFQLYINNLCSHIQFVASKFERGAIDGSDSYNNLIEIYEGVYETVFSNCFFANNTSPTHILVKNNLTSFIGCMFSSSTKQIIKNTSVSDGFGNGIIINGCTFQYLRGSLPIEVRNRAIITNNSMRFSQDIENNKISMGSYCVVSNNVITGDNVNSPIFYMSGNNNKFSNNSYYDLSTIFDTTSLKNNIIDTHISRYLARQAIDIDCSKSYIDIYFNGESSVKIDSTMIYNPFGNSEVNIFSANNNLSIDKNLLGFNQDISIPQNTCVTLTYMQAIEKWKIKSFVTLNDLPNPA